MPRRMSQSLLVVLVALVVLLAAPALAGPILPVEQERWYERVDHDGEGTFTVTRFDAPDFGPFVVSGHDSSISSTLLTGDLSASGGASGPFPETSRSAFSEYRVVFDLLVPRWFDLDARLETHDNYFFGLGHSEVSLSFFDSGLGTFQPLIRECVGNCPLSEGVLIVDERILLQPGQYQVEAFASGDGFYGSQGPITGSGDVEFTFTLPEPGSAVLAGLGLVVLGLRRRRRRLAGPARIG